MYRILYKIFILLLGLLLLTGCGSGQEQAYQETQEANKEFTVTGSGSNLPLTGKLIEGYYQESGIKMDMPPSIGSNGAINAVKEGAIDLGLISRPLKEKEQQESIKVLPYARVGVVIGVNRNVPDNNITYQDLVDIYLGKKAFWKNGDMIIVLSREEGDSSNSVLGKEVPGFREALQASFEKQLWQVYDTDVKESVAIVSTSASIGLTDTGALAVSKPKIKPLKVNGIAPTIDNINNGSYKLVKDLSFIYKEPPSERSQKFLSFVYSPKGYNIIAANGGIPIRGK